ncbi:hypothetical protein [Coxiella burnetii]|uniref:hypothetical protein n=1 Tax=Coxiella burnetii TaxID=777 RepID=UPI0021ADA311|nr:hypothetical protein [Coxiella burnetii]
MIKKLLLIPALLNIPFYSAFANMHMDFDNFSPDKTPIVKVESNIEGNIWHLGKKIYPRHSFPIPYGVQEPADLTHDGGDGDAYLYVIWNGKTCELHASYGIFDNYSLDKSGDDCSFLNIDGDRYVYIDQSKMNDSLSTKLT